MPTLAGNKHLSVLFFFHKLRLFHHSTEKCRGRIRQKGTSKWLLPRRPEKILYSKDQKDFPYEKSSEKCAKYK